MEFDKDSLWDFFKACTALGKPAQQDPVQEETPAPVTLIKQNKFDEEQMQVIEVMYCPPEQDDLHGERMSEMDIRKMVDNFNANISNVSGNLGHIKNTEKFKPVKAWVNEVDCYIGDELVVEGTPLVKIQFYDEDLYQARKEGKLQGLSIGALGRKETKD
ncbi:hypothetical protein [Citrobacter phage Tr1]|nr:hypothetical protein [Citrobacter phage Tr1]